MQTNLEKMFELDTKRFKDLITTSNLAFKLSATELVSRATGINSSFDSEFGPFLAKILYPLNTSQIKTEGSKIVGGKSFYKSKYGKKKRISPKAFYHLFSNDFVNTVQRPKKRAVVQDFLNFRNASLNALAQFNPRTTYKLDIPLELLTADKFEVTPITQANRIDPEEYYSNLQITPISDVSINFFFNRKVAMPKSDQILDVAGENILNGPAVSIILSRPSTFLGMFQVSFNPRKKTASVFDLFSVGAEARLSYNRITPSSYDSVSPIRICDGSEPVLNSNVLGQLVYDLPENFEQAPKSANGVPLNLSQILDRPVVQNVILDYIKAWQTISKSWAYLQQKYAYLVLLSGDF